MELKLGNQYIIPFKGLRDGEHKFEFCFEKLFFEKHEVLEARDGYIKAEILLYKDPQLITLNISIAGNLQVQCDRCLDFFDLPVNINSKLIVKFSSDIADSTDDIWIIHPNENEIDLEQYFFESIGLAIPVKKIHPTHVGGKSGCNPDMLHIIETLSSDHNEEDIDPRWDKLRNLMNDNNLN